MQTQTFEISTAPNGTFLEKNQDIADLNTWSDHYRASQVPFLVVREITTQIAIYKQRMDFSKNQINYTESSGAGDLGLLS